VSSSDIQAFLAHLLKGNKTSNDSTPPTPQEEAAFFQGHSDFHALKGYLAQVAWDFRFRHLPPAATSVAEGKSSN